MSTIQELEAKVDDLSRDFHLAMSDLRGELAGQKIDLRHLIESLAEMRRLVMARGEGSGGR